MKGGGGGRGGGGDVIPKFKSKFFPERNNHRRRLEYLADTDVQIWRGKYRPAISPVTIMISSIFPLHIHCTVILLCHLHFVPGFVPFEAILTVSYI